MTEKLRITSFSELCDIAERELTYEAAIDKVLSVFADMVVEFFVKIYLPAEEEYKKNHKRFPGSYRTKRLRKKRISRIMKERNHDEMAKARSGLLGDPLREPA